MSPATEKGMENVTITALGAMRVTFALAITGLVGMAISPLSFAQEQGQEQAPANSQFGPRVKPQAGARAGQGQAPTATTLATHGDWKIQCEKIPEGQAPPGTPPEQCGMVQTAHNEKEPQAQLTIIIVKQKEKEKVVPAMRVMAPLGVFLPTGIALEIDGAAVGRVPFARCTRQVCYATATASPEMLDKMRKGTNANFIIYQGPGLGMPMKISLNGFSAAFEDLHDP
jgi:invasion protein IalB